MGYNPFAPRYLARPMRRFLQTVNVRHRETCPMCGKKLVNLYRAADGRWMCHRCILKREGVQE